MIFLIDVNIVIVVFNNIYILQAGTEVSFASNGKAHIHLTGYLTDADEDGLNLEDLAEEEIEEEEEEEMHGKKKKHKNLEKNERKFLSCYMMFRFLNFSKKMIKK